VRFSCGFGRSKDYIVINFENPVKNQVTIEGLVLTLDTAKEISMLKRTEKEKKAVFY
jgi:phage anti-repressor protein